MADIETATESVIKPKKMSKSSLSIFDETLYKDKQLKKNIVPITRLLDGKEICVINGNDEISDEEIIEQLLLHRAKVVRNPRKETYCIIVGNDKKAKAHNIIKTNKYDVVTLDWFKRITKEENWGTLEDFLPWDFLSIRDTTKQLLMEKYDDYYDSYTMDVDEESLQRSLTKMEPMIKEIELTFIEEQALDKELFDNGISPFSVFKQIIGYFKQCSDLIKLKFRFMGGLINEDLNEHINYIFIEDKSLITEFNETMNETMKVIDSKWIDECFQDEKLYSIDEYIIK
ncbi:PREDICTED: DNA ligase 4-like [Polistes dominula]|uniref:DNA ligase 4-like n=1 Tax=Polistes dominula TaxID=743375 RepID=A0ABM1ICY0_POLDO|nr:PREDICTED: DNA ligase 4-like [Polistes dominula]